MTEAHAHGHILHLATRYSWQSSLISFRGVRTLMLERPAMR